MTLQTVFNGFVDESELAPEPAPAGPPPVVIGRSEADRWASCPHMAALIDRKLVSTGNELTDVGNEVHRILSTAVHTFTEGAHQTTVRDEMEAAAMSSRPDLQPKVLDALNVYRCTSLLCTNDYAPRHPDDVLRFDGGPLGREGQLSAELMPAEGDRGPVIITGELDFLAATASTEEVDLLDWKSGWKHWTAGLVEGSFQFQWYALLIWMNYPGVQRVRVRVVETRTGQTTAPVVFVRNPDQPRITARVRAAVEQFLQYRGADVEKVPAWPSPDKCATCDAAVRCKLAHAPAVDVARDPEGALRQLVVLQEAATRLNASLSVYRRQQCRDLDFGDVAYGTDKPKKTRAATCEVYSPTSKGE